MTVFKDFKYCFCKIRKNVFMFNSFNGLFNDNPKPILFKIHEVFPDSEIVLVISEHHKPDNLPSFVKTVFPKTDAYYFYKNTAQIIVDNYTGLYGTLCKKSNFIGLTISYLKRVFLKRKQYRISTWHGTPLKLIGLDSVNRKRYKYIYTTDCLIAGSDYEKQIFESAFGMSDVFAFGNPRNDVLFSKDPSLKEVTRRKLGLPLDKNILLYAPTFRDWNNNSSFRSNYSIDSNKVLDAFRTRFGGEWILVYRVHQNVQKVISAEASLGTMLDGNLHDDMADYLLCSDALITDYSGSLFDILVTEKPCFLYAPDLEIYKKQRGLYMDLDSLPFPVSSNDEGLCNDILQYDKTASLNKRASFCLTIGNKNDGKATERVVTLIENFLTYGTKNRV